MQRQAWSGVMVLGLLAAVACGGSTTDGSTAGAGATAGVGGAGAQGGTAGSGGAGASGGTGGSGGAGASGGTGGSGGAGASGGNGGSGGAVQPECATAADCRLDEDCCTCAAVPVGAPPSPVCLADCSETACTRLGVVEPACLMGRCTPAVNCDAGQVTCRAATPLCAPGEVPAVKDSCWNGCVPATACARVADCQACGPAAACVTRSVGPGVMTHCVTVPDACAADRSCACLGQSVCPETCGDVGGTIDCCPMCE